MFYSKICAKYHKTFSRKRFKLNILNAKYLILKPEGDARASSLAAVQHTYSGETAIANGCGARTGKTAIANC